MLSLIMKKIRLSLRASARTYLILLLVSVCAAFAGLLYYFYHNRIDDAQRQALAQTKLFSEVAAKAVDALHAEALSHAKSLGQRPDALSYTHGGVCPGWLLTEANERGYSNIFLVDPSGAIVCSAYSAAERKAPPNPFITDSFNHELGAIGSFYNDGQAWVYPALFFAPGSSGKPGGAVLITLRSDRLDPMRDALIDRGAETSYIDSDRTVGLARISHSNMHSGEVASTSLRAALDSGLIGRSALLPDDTFVAGSRALLSGWSVVSKLKSKDVYEPLLAGVFHQTISLALLCLAALIAIWGIANRLAAATSVLVRAAGNADSLFSSRSTGISEIDEGIAEMRRASRKHAKAQVAVELWRSAAERTRSGMAIVRKTEHADGKISLVIELCNPAFETLSSMGPCVGRDLLVDAPAMSALADASVVAEMRSCATHGGPASRAGQGLDPLGLPRHVQLSLEPIVVEESSARELFCLTLEDITDIAQREAQAARHGTIDALTNLPNRALFTSLLSKSIDLSARGDSLCAVAMFDLDHFKFINDSIGHEQGDKVIALVAERLTERLRPGDTLSRFGGDEFGMVFADVDDVQIVASLVEHARAAVAAPVTMAGQVFHLTFSAGVAVHPVDGSDAKSLMSAADIAMFQAKENGRGNVKFHSKTMSDNFTERLNIEKALKTALAEQSVEFLYQPKISLSTGQPCGMEALARWHHPTLGVISPARFIPLAEESELIATLGDLAIKSALRDAKVLWDEGFRNMPVAINVSARQIKDGFINKLIAALLASGLPASAVHVEITESSAMVASEATTVFLSELSRLGIKLALDDFGTGWSNMSMLKTLPLSYLKMDRSFIVGLGKDEKDAAIAKAVIGLAKALGVEVIAEGVETQMQAQQLIYLQADQLQGYYVCKPMGIKDVSAWLHSGYVFQGSQHVQGALAPLSIHDVTNHS